MRFIGASSGNSTSCRLLPVASQTCTVTIPITCSSVPTRKKLDAPEVKFPTIPQRSPLTNGGQIRLFGPIYDEPFLILLPLSGVPPCQDRELLQTRKSPKSLSNPPISPFLELRPPFHMVK